MPPKRQKRVTRKRPQRLPTRIEAACGEVKVRLRAKVSGSAGEECWGTWDEGTRTIAIDKTATDHQRWKTYFHEHTHVALADSGLDEMIPAEQVEAICDAVSTARMREKFG